MNRTSSIKRDTLETQIKLSLNIDGSGNSDISTGVGFFDHMLTLFSKHGFFDLDATLKGDLDVDCHHCIEDMGIALGKAFSQALGEKEGITRYGHAIVPMEEALVLCAVDISGRPLLVFDCEFTVPRIGELDTEMVEEFFRAFCLHSGVNLHLKVLAGKNNHHIAEGVFKSFAKAMDLSCTLDPRVKGVLSTKGMLES